MKKLIFAFSVVVLVLSSCSKSEETPVPEPIDTTSDVLLKKAVTTRGSIVTTDMYSYVGKKIDKIVSNDGTTNSETKYTYTGDLITKIEFFTNAVLKSKKEYTYQNDKMTGITTYEYNGSVTTKKKTIYNHRLINVNEETAHYKIYSVNMLNNRETLIADGDVYFSGETVSAQLDTDYVSVPSHIMDCYAEYSYGNSKKNPTINIIGYSKLFDNITGSSKGVLGNKKITENVLVNGVSTTQISNYKWTYTYNSSLFPDTRKAFNKNNVLDNTTQFYYE